MTNVCKYGFLVALATLVGVVLSTTLTEPATARPQYAKAVGKFYQAKNSEKALTLIKSKKCGVCHSEYLASPKPRGWAKKRNDFGSAFGKGLTKKNEKSADVLAKAVEAATAATNGDGKSYGSLIEEGELPAP